VALAADGRFLIGFDRDAPRTASLDAHLANGDDVFATLTVAPRAWPIQHVDMARPAGGPTPEYQRLREEELRRIGAARRQRSLAAGWAQRFIWPARGRISGAFGSQRIYRGGVPAAYHSGTDIAAGAGAPVVAPADGVVTLAPPPGFSLEGNLVIVDHGMGLTSAFLHLSSAVVRSGQTVRRGELIGRVGATGRATGPHLHWSLVWNGARVDPAGAVGGAPP
jgi:murein DD-endopeptidase MepM/ murein hydrolase activator NlpD